MAIYLDDITVELGGDSLGAVLLAANRRLQADGRIVVEIEMDGQALDGATLAAQRENAVSGHELRLRSADPRELATQVLDQVRTRLNAARQTQADCAAMLQQDKAPEALTKFNDVVSTWLQVQEAVLSSTRLLGMSVDELAFEGQTAAEATSALVEALQSLKRMIQDGDTVGIADALAYEWPAMTDQWDTMLAGLIERIETKS